MKRLYKKSLYKIFVSFFIIFYSFVPQALAIDEVINTLQEDYAVPMEEVVIPNEEITQTPIEESSEATIEEEAIPKEELPDSTINQEEEILAPEELPMWSYSGNIAVTNEVVELNKRYELPEDDSFSITFTRLPESTSKLSLEKITLTQEEVDATGSVTRVVYDIKTEMLDGTFEYDLTLPSNSEVKKVLYAEERSDILGDLKEVENSKEIGNEIVEVSGLDHFTIFISSDIGDTPTLTTAMVNNMPYVFVPPSTPIEVTITVETSGSGSEDDWRSSQYQIEGGSWVCVNTSNHSGDGTYTEDFDIVAPSTVGTYNLSLRAYNGDSCSGGVSPDYTMTDAITVITPSPTLVPPVLTVDPSDPVAMTSVSGIWTEIDGGSGHQGIGTNEIRWGSPAGAQKSGLRFTNSGTQSFDTGENFYLGMLTHMNWPTYSGTAADGARLEITLNFDKPDIPNVVLDYDFEIDETLNSAGSCPIFQQSLTPCDDNVTFPNSYGNTVFTIGDIQYTLVIDGFVDSYPIGTPVDEFITEEQKDNSAFLVGYLSSVLVERPEIRLTKKTNNIDVTGAPGPEVTVGDSVEWQYIIQNSGNVELLNISITDNPLANIDCDPTTAGLQNSGLSLVAGASMTCTATGTVTLGQYSNTATVTGNPEGGEDVTASDTSWYTGVLPKGSIKIIKNALPESEQDFTFSSLNNTLGSFTLDDDGDNGNTYKNYIVFENLTQGTHQITEDVPIGWELSNISCVGSGQWAPNGSTLIVDVVPGEEVVCTFTNTIEKGTIIVEKQVLPDGHLQTFNFTGEVSGTLGDDDQLEKDVLPGTYTVSEINPSTSGYQLKSIVCDDGSSNSPSTVDLQNGKATFNIEPNETVTCVFTNEIFGSVTAHKYHNLNQDEDQDIGEPNLQGWAMTLYMGNDCKETDILSGPIYTDVNGDATFFSIIPGNNYSIKETLKDGWENVSDICQNFTVNPGESKQIDFGNIHKPITINAHKIVCSNESELPNWGMGGPNIDENTAQNWVNTHSSCEFQEGWSFQWGEQSASNPGDNTGLSLNSKWHTFGATDTKGFTTVEIPATDIEGFNSIWMREVWDSGYIPFTYNIVGGNSENVTAEIYCHTDVLNYDNLDRIDNIQNGETYYCVAWNVEANPGIEIEKSGPEYAVKGEQITYEYEVINKGNVPLTVISVTDDKCSPVLYKSGDDGDNLLEVGEVWEYDCTTTVSWTFPTSFTNIAEAKGSYYDQVLVDEDEFTLYPFTLRKDVLLYWDGDKIQYSDPNTQFTVDLKKGDNILGTEIISESSPLNLWLSEGTYHFCEKDLPEGYIKGYECINYTTGQGYPDWTQINVITFDLAIDKIAPSVAYKGETITYEYEVTNSGPASVIPVVEDDLCAPVEYESGDTDSDGKIDSGEAWVFTCDYEVTESGGDIITNTATVHNQEEESWDNTGWYLGGDRELTNNTDTEETPVRAGSISVCKLILTPDGKITDGSEVPVSNFSILGLDVKTSQGDPAGVLPETSFSTPLNLNKDGYECITYTDLAIGHFYYGEESYEDPWNEPRYNDSNLNWNSAISYSGELFDADPSNDSQRDTVGDGDILLTKSRLNRTLLVINQYPYSSIQGRKYYDVNINGDFDKEERININRLNGWTINLYNNQWELIDSMQTGDDTTQAGNVAKGQYRFENVLAGTYYVCEEPQEGWYQTEPSTGVQHPDTDLYCHTVNLRPVEDKEGIQFGNYQGSDVKICKQDNYNRPLSRWGVVLASEQVYGPTSINVSNGSGTNSSNLPAGTYLIKVSGIYRYGNSQMIADAGYSFRPVNIPYGTGGWVSGFDLPSKGLMAWIDGSPVNWGTYNSEHEYTYVYDHLGGPINVSIYDDNYGDNVNNGFEFEIFKVNDWAKGTTGRNGCVTLEAVPYGEYILDEYLPTDWTDISNKGSGVTIDEMDERFVIKNRLNAPVTIVATKIVCDYESDLPNWGAIKSEGNPITQERIDQFLEDSEGRCRVVPDWEFEWGYQGAGNPGDEYIGYGGVGWNTFGVTNSNGEATAVINNIQGNRIELREVLQENYIPFTYGSNGNNSDNFSAEFYCHNDVMNYDNWEWLNTPEYGQTYYCVGFNTLARTDIHGYKWLDVNRNGVRDCIEQEAEGILEELINPLVTLFEEREVRECEQEPLLSGWKIFVDENENSTWDEGEQSMLTDGDEHYGWYWFEDLLPGEYRICEEMPSDWAQTYPGEPVDSQCHTILLPNDCSPYGDNILEARIATPNAVQTFCEFNFGNVQESQLYISETNDSWPNILSIGDTFTYTITVRALNGPITDVTVINLPPEGIIPQGGTFSAISSERGTLDTSGVAYASPGEWDLGDMRENESITISYTALVTGDISSGIYPDLSLAKGVGITESEILALSEESPFEINNGIVSEYFVGTQVKVEESPEIEEGEVLGASIELPQTGAETYLTLGALISIILGLILLVFNPKRKIKKLIIAGVLLLGIFTFVKPTPTYAIDNISVKISQPETPTKESTFNVGFVALDLLNRPISIQCFTTGDIPFGVVNTTNSGNCLVDSSLISTSGTYDFYVIATAGGESKKSETVSVVVDLEKPLPVLNYSNTEGICSYTLKFKTANDNQTSKIQIFRSDKQPFTANASTMIKEMSVGPNVEVTYTDTPLPSCSTEYYYAIRSVDDFNNTSTFVTDDIVTVVYTQGTTTTNVTVTDETGEVAGETTTDEEGNGTGGDDETTTDENGEVAGETTEDENGEGTEGEGNVDEEDQSFWGEYKYVIIFLGVVLLSSVGYIYVKRRK